MQSFSQTLEDLKSGCNVELTTQVFWWKKICNWNTQTVSALPWKMCLLIFSMFTINKSDFDIYVSDWIWNPDSINVFISLNKIFQNNTIQVNDCSKVIMHDLVKQLTKVHLFRYIWIFCISWINGSLFCCSTQISPNI